MTQFPTGSPAYYRLSGRFSPGGLLIALTGAAVAGLVLGAIYGPVGFLCQMIPYTKLSAILLGCAALGFGVVLGILAGRLCKWAHVRNTPLTLLVAGICGFLGLYSAWIFWIYTLFQYVHHPLGLLDLAWPPDLWAVMAFLNKKGVWAISGNDLVSGVLLWIFWALEAGLILGTLAVIARKTINEFPFCETCQKWGVRKLLLQLGPANAAELATQCTRKDFAALSQRRPLELGSRQWFDLFLEGCATCDNLQTLTVEQIIETADKKGKTQQKRSTLVRRLILEPTDTIALAQAAATMKLGTMPPPPEPPQA